MQASDRTLSRQDRQRHLHRMSKYKYYFIIQLQKSPTRWKDICKMDGAECSAADMERKLAAFRSRNANSVYRVIRRRINNNGENYNIFRNFD